MKSNFDSVIGIGYKKYMGKDTLADFLVENHGYTKIPFAEHLKDVAKLLFGFTHDQLYDPELKEIEDEYWGFTPRWALQVLGTEACRNNIDNDIWVKVVFKNAIDRGVRKLVIPDMRFPNEAQAVKDAGGILVRVQRECVDTSDKSCQHPSETILDDFKDWNVTVHNDADMSFMERVAEMLDDRADKRIKDMYTQNVHYVPTQTIEKVQIIT